jgi:hypothetical protein
VESGSGSRRRDGVAETGLMGGGDEEEWAAAADRHRRQNIRLVRWASKRGAVAANWSIRRLLSLSGHWRRAGRKFDAARSGNTTGTAANQRGVGGGEGGLVGCDAAWSRTDEPPATADDG